MTVYFAETTTEEQRGLLCRWAEHFYGRGQRVQIVVDSTPAAQYLDTLLWTFAQGSFVPHAIHGASAEEQPMEPVLICIGEIRVEGVGAVLCDAAVGFDFLLKFETAVHFILRDDPARKQESRLLWQKVREAGLKPVHVPYGAGPGGE